MATGIAAQSITGGHGPRTPPRLRRSRIHIPPRMATQVKAGMKKGGKAVEKVTRHQMPSVVTFWTPKSSEEEDDGGENDDEIRVPLSVWEFVDDVPNPEWCWNNHIDDIEYNRRTGEYRYTTLDPWHEQYAWA